MTDHGKKRRAMDETANEIIRLETIERLPRICTSRIDNELLKNASILANIQIMQPEQYFVGSVYEGFPHLATNDIDLMVCLQTFPIVLWESKNESGAFVIAEQVKNRPPTYLRLKVADKAYLPKDFRCMINEDGYLKTSDFIAKTYSHNSYFEKSYKNEMRHGPAINVGYNSNFVDIGTGLLDVVHCLKCQSWPDFTSEFLNRNRENNWPSQKLIDKVKGLECHVVPVGYPGSKLNTIEWRLSFSIAERELITEMYEQYAECMFTLKCIKKKYIKYEDSVKPTPFSSYVIKTACLWMCEKFPPTDSVMDLIRNVLDWIIDCYKQKHLPHYFIPQHNLIGHLPPKVCDDVGKKLAAIKGNLFAKVLSSVGSGDTCSCLSDLNLECDMLNISKGNGDDKCSILLEKLLIHPETIECMRSSLCFKFNLVKNLKMQKFATYNHTSFASLITEYVQKDPLVNCSVPKEIIMPIVDNIKEIVPKGYVEMFKTSLYRFLGDIYTHLLVCLRNSGGMYNEDLANTPLHYYNLGAKMDFSDNYGDNGIGGEVLLVKYHYIMGNYKGLKQMCDCILEKDGLGEKNCRLAFVLIVQEEKAFCTSPSLFSAWAADEILLYYVKCVISNKILYCHPIILVLYIKARVLLTEGDTENTLKVVKEMKKYMNERDSTYISTATPVFITIIESLTSLLCVMRIIYYYH
ncbi:uncharacterized protein LOC117117473 [Anneissia japonica]|uniref:uncharacterized protein LOC117117473 n=1 Tax=Anneissia japonica TaxID=1529436 RepID=UPI0014256A6D|nr:uncharacterized protein LOC117117473 [Anneissia japonica]